MECCLCLSRADTHTSVLEWFSTPLADLQEWVEAIDSLEKKVKRKKK
jgi:hypothetical protein